MVLPGFDQQGYLGDPTPQKKFTAWHLPATLLSK
jgi:hypothetical protein